jgi:hypothetical protein
MSTTPKLDACIDQLAAALSSEHVSGETREMVTRLFADKYVKFVEVHLKPSSATITRESVDLLQPSDLLLELIAALAAHDFDRVAQIDHRLRS